MTYSFLGPDPLEVQLERVLEQLAGGFAPRDVETALVDVKEEPGRRSASGAILAGSAENEPAAAYLAGEMACFANTPRGGAVIVGIADNGDRIGTALDGEWLRHRIWQLTEQKLTVTVRTVELDATRLLVVTTHEAIEPIRYAGKLKWRVADNCVEVDATTWHTGRIGRTGIDWSAQQSGHAITDANPVAIEIARRYLQAAGDEASIDLAAANDHDLLRRLNVVDGAGMLTNAGSLLFVGTPDAGVDYIRRDIPGGDSTNRLRSNRPLIEQVTDVDKASQSANRLVHIPEGFAHGQLRAIPGRAVREAIVNGVVHRDWLSAQPTVIEHVGDTLTVTSPGGFIGGVGPSNIITHPAVPRYRSLAEAMATLRLAEREGIGIDRIVHDMLALGHPQPEISELAGPYVRLTLIGGEPDTEIIEFLNLIDPSSTASNVDALLLIDHLIHNGWVDAGGAGPILQRSDPEANTAIQRLSVAAIDGLPIMAPIKGVPADTSPAYRFSDAAIAKLAGRLVHRKDPGLRTALIMRWARARGRVSSTEVSDLTGLSIPYAGITLANLEEDGQLLASRPNRRGRGYFYFPTQS